MNERLEKDSVLLRRQQEEKARLVAALGRAAHDAEIRELGEASTNMGEGNVGSSASVSGELSSPADRSGCPPCPPCGDAAVQTAPKSDALKGGKPVSVKEEPRKPRKAAPTEAPPEDCGCQHEVIERLRGIAKKAEPKPKPKPKPKRRK